MCNGCQRITEAAGQFIVRVAKTRLISLRLVFSAKEKQATVAEEFWLGSCCCVFPQVYQTSGRKRPPSPHDLLPNLLSVWDPGDRSFSSIPPSRSCKSDHYKTPDNWTLLLTRRERETRRGIQREVSKDGGFS